MAKYEVTYRTKYAKDRHTHYRTWDNRKAAQNFADGLNKPSGRPNRAHNARVKRKRPLR